MFPATVEDLAEFQPSKYFVEKETLMLCLIMIINAKLCMPQTPSWIVSFEVSSKCACVKSTRFDWYFFRKMCTDKRRKLTLMNGICFWSGQFRGERKEINNNLKVDSRLCVKKE